MNKSSSFGSSEERVTLNKAETSQPVFLQKLGPSVHLAKDVDDGSEYFGRIATAASGESANVLVEAGPSETKKESINTSLLYSSSEVQVTADKVESFRPNFLKKLSLNGGH